MKWDKAWAYYSCFLFFRGTDYGTPSEHKRSSAMPSQGSLFTNFEDVQVTLYNSLSCPLFTQILSSQEPLL